MSNSKTFFFPILAGIIYTWTYYLYINLVWFHFTSVKKFIYIAIVSISWFMVVFSLLSCILTKLHSIPEEYKFTDIEHETFSEATNQSVRNTLLAEFVQTKRLEIQTCSKSGHIRYCFTCRHIKPDRTHHCRSCNICVLKMDHHCPWINNCVGFSNHKQFMLLLFYSTMYSSLFLLTAIEYVVQFWRTELNTNYVYIHFIAGYIMTFSTCLFTLSLFCHNMDLILKNQTTIEKLYQVYFLEAIELTFNLGSIKNLEQVFGRKSWRCLIPVSAKDIGNGHQFKTYPI